MIKTGLEIVRQHKEYEEKIAELSDAVVRLEEYNYTKSILRDELSKLRADLQFLEDTRFKPLDPIVIHTSLLGGKS
ncbi:hypothetical protein HSX37_13035|uniref:Uncharacterized protein n=1 Tax=Dendrosporobacter quercicolus TaxID=146817 RepID=A0A1G9Z2Y7_9FIRM|nr:hypothetical protein [Dendrosporobacter quercicolus]NSL48960.1 hypothetical protein [Dendrosporobacter quercicolus DSM 1736]SDN15808.1 hypothetical protein SAMN04488502_11323 [Dendrosporobacter quercicolus]